MRKMKIGLLPHYLELYDSKCSEYRPEMEKFSDTIARRLGEMGYDILRGRTCRVSAEFAGEIRFFEEKGAEAIVSLHLAYSPSLESIGALSRTRIPLIIFDTTPDPSFSPGADPARIMFNHGIHGVQDLCNMLLRKEKEFIIVAGHWKCEETLAKLGRAASAARMAHWMGNSRTGLIGKPFHGMGDFSVPFDILAKNPGIKVIPFDFRTLEELLPAENSAEVREEMENDNRLFDRGEFSPAEHAATARASIAVRKWIEKERLTAFSMNFLDAAGKKRLPAVPFLEASKAMASGTGYAGEGDVLTASFARAFLSEYPQSTFTEMFCPDWKTGQIFLSHMGEVNIDLLDGNPLMTRCSFPIEGSAAPVFVSGRLIPGKAIFANLAPGKDGAYTLISAEVKMERTRDTRFRNSVRGWMKPGLEIGDFLEGYSRAGGTHHSVLSYGCDSRVLANFAGLMGWKFAGL